MNKQEILALMMREDGQTAGDVFALVAILSEQLASTGADPKTDDDARRLISAGAALYHLGMEKYGPIEAMDGLFPRSEAWPNGPASRPGKYRH